MAKGKYAEVIDSLPRSFGEEPDYQAKIDIMKEQILQPVSDSATEEDQEVLSSEAIENVVEEIAAMLALLNDNLIRAVGRSTDEGHPLRGSKLAAIFRDLRRIKSTLEEQEKKTNLLLDAYGQIMVEQYEAEGITSIKLEDGGSVRYQPEPHTKVVDKDANRKWAVANGYESMLSIPWQTVNAIAKENLLKGEDLPDGTELINRPKIVYTKG